MPSTGKLSVNASNSKRSAPYSLKRRGGGRLRRVDLGESHDSNSNDQAAGGWMSSLSNMVWKAIPFFSGRDQSQDKEEVDDQESEEEEEEEDDEEEEEEEEGGEEGEGEEPETVEEGDDADDQMKGIDASGSSTNRAREEEDEEEENDSNEPLYNGVPVSEIPYLRLRSALKACGLKNTGKKDQLIQRLRNHLQTGVATPAPAAPAPAPVASNVKHGSVSAPRRSSRKSTPAEPNASGTIESRSFTHSERVQDSTQLVPSNSTTTGVVPSITQARAQLPFATTTSVVSSASSINARNSQHGTGLPSLMTASTARAYQAQGAHSVAGTGLPRSLPPRSDGVLHEEVESVPTTPISQSHVSALDSQDPNMASAASLNGAPAAGRFAQASSSLPTFYTPYQQARYFHPQQHVPYHPPEHMPNSNGPDSISRPPARSRVSGLSIAASPFGPPRSGVFNHSYSSFGNNQNGNGNLGHQPETYFASQAANGTQTRRVVPAALAERTTGSMQHGLSFQPSPRDGTLSGSSGQGNTAAVPSFKPATTSATAKRILETLDEISSPLSDARRPASAAYRPDPKRRKTQASAYQSPSAATGTDQTGAPPAMSLSSPVASGDASPGLWGSGKEKLGGSASLQAMAAANNASKAAGSAAGSSTFTFALGKEAIQAAKPPTSSVPTATPASTSGRVRNAKKFGMHGVSSAKRPPGHQKAAGEEDSEEEALLETKEVKELDALGAPPTATARFSFGALPSTTLPSTSDSKKSPSTTFSFGASTSSTDAGEDKSGSTTTPAFTFGGQSASTTSSDSKKDDKPSSTGFTFGGQSTPTAAASATGSTSGGWKCPCCTADNTADASTCKDCMINKPASATAASTADKNSGDSRTATTTKPAFSFGVPPSSADSNNGGDTAAVSKTSTGFSFGVKTATDGDTDTGDHVPGKSTGLSFRQKVAEKLNDSSSHQDNDGSSTAIDLTGSDDDDDVQGKASGKVTMPAFSFAPTPSTNSTGASAAPAFSFSAAAPSSSLGGVSKSSKPMFGKSKSSGDDSQPQRKKRARARSEEQDDSSSDVEEAPKDLFQFKPQFKADPSKPSLTTTTTTTSRSGKDADTGSSKEPVFTGFKMPSASAAGSTGGDDAASSDKPKMPAFSFGNLSKAPPTTFSWGSSKPATQDNNSKQEDKNEKEESADEGSGDDDGFNPDDECFAPCPDSSDDESGSGSDDGDNNNEEDAAKDKPFTFVSNDKPFSLGGDDQPNPFFEKAPAPKAAFSWGDSSASTSSSNKPAAPVPASTGFSFAVDKPSPAASTGFKLSSSAAPPAFSFGAPAASTTAASTSGSSAVFQFSAAPSTKAPARSGTAPTSQAPGIRPPAVFHFGNPAPTAADSMMSSPPTAPVASTTPAFTMGASSSTTAATSAPGVFHFGASSTPAAAAAAAAASTAVHTFGAASASVPAPAPTSAAMPFQFAAPVPIDSSSAAASSVGHAGFGGQGGQGGEFHFGAAPPPRGMEKASPTQMGRRKIFKLKKR